MRMNDELWETRWLPKLNTVLDVLRDSNDSSFVNVSELRRMVKTVVRTACDNPSLRVACIGMVKNVVNHAPNSEQLNYIMKARSSLPYRIVELIDTICQQVADEAEANFANTHWLMRLELKRTTQYNYTEPYDEMRGYYRVSTYDTMTPNQYGKKQYNTMSRRLKEWYKMGVWRGDEEELGTVEFVERLTRFKRGQDIGE
jgi:hypothetical protein